MFQLKIHRAAWGGGSAHLVTVEPGINQTFDPSEDQSAAQGRARALPSPKLSETDRKRISA